MRTTKLLVAAAVSLAGLGILAPSAALAGEVNGTGEYIHGDADSPLPARSACAYSGLEDHPEYALLDSNTKPGRLTQTPHYVFDDTPGGANDFVYPAPGTPGVACRGGAE
jgi:hypothetical protein